MSASTFFRRIGANAGRTARLAGARASLPSRGAWLLVRIGPALREQRAPSLPLGLGREPQLAFMELLQTLDAAARDPALAGVVLRFQGGVGGLAKALALRRSLAALRSAGKRVVAWGESYDTEQYVVASAAERVWLPESGSLYLLGLRSEQLFVRDLLRQLQLKPEVLRVGTHKTAGEALTRSGMSPEQREQVEAWHADAFGALVEALAESRGLNAEQVRALIDAGPYGAREAADAGLCDGCLYPDEVEDALLEMTPADALAGARTPRDPDAKPRPRLVHATVYHALRAGDAGWRPLLRDLPHLAYVVAAGAVHRGAGPRGIGGRSFGELLTSLREERRVRGVLLRIDSPGGDAVASDLLYRAVERLAQEKPVVVSMGEVAASGGYYLAAAANSIFAEDCTLTGSIGVVGGKLDASGLLERFGVRADWVDSGARAGMLSALRGLENDERKALEREMEGMYATFVARVAQGRGMQDDAVRRVAQGRIWSGARAVSVGLADALGGPLEALRELQTRAGLRAGERFVLDPHPRHHRLPALGSWFGGLRGPTGLG